MKTTITTLMLFLFMNTFAFAKAVIVDVRESDEIKAGMIKGAIWLPLSGVESNSPEALKTIQQFDKKDEIQLYCKSGRRSGKVAEILKKQGFNVKNLGGYEDVKKSQK